MSAIWLIEHSHWGVTSEVVHSAAPEGVVCGGLVYLAYERTGASADARKAMHLWKLPDLLYHQSVAHPLQQLSQRLAVRLSANALW